MFGVQAGGLYSDAEPRRTVPAMAAAYVDTVRAVRPTGPYLLGGCAVHDTGASEVWVTHGAEDALVHWCGLQGLAARPLRIVGYGEEDESDGLGPPEANA